MVSSNGNMEEEVEVRIENAAAMIIGISEALLRKKWVRKQTAMWRNCQQWYMDVKYVESIEVIRVTS